MCTFPECKDSNKTYRTRLRFINHEMEEHPGRWDHPFAVQDCHETFQDPIARFQHMETHSLSLKAVAQELTLNPVKHFDYLFCGKRIQAAKLNLARHLGRHMEKISFAVVTKTYEDWGSYEDSSHVDSFDSTPGCYRHRRKRPSK